MKNSYNKYAALLTFCYYTVYGKNRPFKKKIIETIFLILGMFLTTKKETVKYSTLI